MHFDQGIELVDKLLISNLRNEYSDIPSLEGGHNGDGAENTRDIWTNTRWPVIILWLYFNFVGSYVMTTYACNKCGMAVSTNYAKCDVAPVDDSLGLGNGNKVQIAKCPSCKGKIKSPSCCGEEMACSI